MSSDLRIAGSTVHVEGCLWAGRRTSRRWFESGSTPRERIVDAIRRQGFTACPDCRPLDTLTSTTPEGARRG